MSARVLVAQTSGETALASMAQLRLEVWRARGFLLESRYDHGWCDEHEGHAFHWTAHIDGELVAAARMCVHDRLDDVPDADELPLPQLEGNARGPVASLNRLVVHERARRMGIASRLDQARVDFARALGVRCVVARAVGPVRADMLARLGFAAVGEARSIANLPTSGADKVLVIAFVRRHEENPA